MDYRLTGQMTAVQAAAGVKVRYPNAPIIVLSDMYDLPADIAPYVQTFVRKGDPAKLVDTLARFPRSTAARSEGAALYRQNSGLATQPFLHARPSQSGAVVLAGPLLEAKPTSTLNSRSHDTDASREAWGGLYCANGNGAGVGDGACRDRSLH
jgi:hypothetical protein